MAINPLQNITEHFEVVEADVEPLKTYKLEFERGRLRSKKIDRLQALKQFVYKTLRTERFKYIIYDDDYGSELFDVIKQGVPVAFLENELPRVIREALTTHELINDVTDFKMVQNEDKAYISFRVINYLRNFTEEMEVKLFG